MLHAANHSLLCAEIYSKSENNQYLFIFNKKIAEKAIQAVAI